MIYTNLSLSPSPSPIPADSKLNGLNANVAKTRPRIPTPEVTKDGSTNTGKCAHLALVPVKQQQQHQSIAHRS